MIRSLLGALSGALLVSSLAIAPPARAAWLEATTPHFVIDADASEARVRDFAERLERYDRALRYVYRREDDPSRRSNRVRVFAVSHAAIATLCDGCPSGTAGFYHPRAGGSAIFTAALAGRETAAAARNIDLDPQEVLFHEYAHHFMYSNYPDIPFPMWFSEGFADFNANQMTLPNGDVALGTPANYRAWGLLIGPGLPAKALLDPGRSDLVDPARHEAIYGRGWLLMHYLMLNTARRPEIDDYLHRIGTGEGSVAAGRAAFGDLRKLDAALDGYMHGKLNPPLLVPAVATTPSVEVRPLSPGAAAMMPVHLRSTAGVDDRAVQRLWPEAERRAAPFPADPRVQDELAEAEYDADRLDAADAACDRAIAADANDVTALLYKARVATRRLAQAKSREAAGWDAARRWIVRANRADTEAALPLLLYYETFLAQDRAPPPLAVSGLEKAAGLAGEDPQVHWLLARQRIEEGDAKAARLMLAPVAYAPHPDAGTASARAIVELLDAGKLDEARAAIGAKDARPAPAG